MKYKYKWKNKSYFNITKCEYLKTYELSTGGLFAYVTVTPNEEEALITTEPLKLDYNHWEMIPIKNNNILDIE